MIKNHGQKIFDFWNICYAELYGASPLTQCQVDHYKKMYFNFISIDTLSVIVDKADNVIAFGVALPSFTMALRTAKGHLFFRWFYTYISSDE